MTTLLRMNTGLGQHRLSGESDVGSSRAFGRAWLGACGRHGPRRYFQKKLGIGSLFLSHSHSIVSHCGVGFVVSYCMTSVDESVARGALE